MKVSCRLKKRDAEIEVAIGNIFDFQGSLAIGSNTTFDTKVSNNLISEKSIQGQFTAKYYKDSKILDKRDRK